MFTAATYLPKPLCECNVVELGAGVGLVGMFTAAKGSPMTYLTDLQEVSIIKSTVPTLLYIYFLNITRYLKTNLIIIIIIIIIMIIIKVLPVLEVNVKHNPHISNRIKIQRVAWGTEDWRYFTDTHLRSNENHTNIIDHLHDSSTSSSGDVNCSQNSSSSSSSQIDLVLLADCVYWPVLFEPLVSTLRGLCSSEVNGGQGATVIMAHTRRWKKVRYTFYSPHALSLPLFSLSLSSIYIYVVCLCGLCVCVCVCFVFSRHMYCLNRTVLH
jgi:predicted nicotinamide N-methyase